MSDTEVYANAVPGIAGVALDMISIII